MQIFDKPKSLALRRAERMARDSAIKGDKMWDSSNDACLRTRPSEVVIIQTQPALLLVLFHEASVKQSRQSLWLVKVLKDIRRS